MKKCRKNYGIFIAQPENEISIRIMEGASKAAKEVDANLFVLPIGLIDAQYSDMGSNQYCYQNNVLDCFFNVSSLDGIILEYGSIVSNLDDEHKKFFLSKIGEKPCVLLSEDADGFSSVCFDNEAGLKEVILHLIKEHGYTKIGYMSGPKDNHDAIQRLNVFQKVTKEYGLYQEDLVIYGNFSRFCKEMMVDFIEKHKDIEAIVFANDDMVFGAMEAMNELGLIPGEDIALTGFDNTPMGMMHEIPLTSVYADGGEMAYEALKHLDKIVKTNDPTPVKMIVPTKMVKRLSCGCQRVILRDENGNTSFSEDEIEFRNAVNHLIGENYKNAGFMMELRYIQRELVYYTDSEDRWLSEIMKSLMVMGASKCLLLFHEEPIDHDGKTIFELPKEIHLAAVSILDSHELFRFHEKEYLIDELFHNEYVTCENMEELMAHFSREDSITAQRAFSKKNNQLNRSDWLVAPLFFRERQYGFMMVESDINNFLYLYQMTMQIGNTLEMVKVNRMNHKIQSELIKASQTKSLFLANMSHEIRTPINAIMGMNEMILRENENPDIDTYAKDIKGAADNLLSIVNDILDISKIEENKMELVPVSYHLSDVIENVVNQMVFRAQAKDLELISEIDESLPSLLYGDDIRISQILLNILSNAVKYTNTGKVILRLTGKTEGEKAFLHFEVEDTGIGIKPEDLEKLFEKFSRIEEKRNRHIEGTGLGMSITQGLLNLMDSTLQVQSVYNKGSIFSFDLEQKIMDHKTIKETKTTKKVEKKKYQQKFKAPCAKILVVDDNALNRVLMSRLLKNTKIQIDEAVNGIHCIEKYKESCDKEPYDVIFLDHMMPEMDGMEAIAILQKLDSFQKHKIPIIALTANAILGAENEYRKAGFDAYLSKPVNPSKLDDLLIQFLPAHKVEVL